MKQFISEKKFPYKHFTTTKFASNMKDEIVRNSFLSSLKLNPVNLVLANQVHSNNVKIVNAFNKNSFIDNCDGLITTDKDVMLGIFTADCVPLLMSCGNCEFKAAIHAGWKGLFAGIIENTLDILKKDFCIKIEEIKVYIGPHICSRCYEVGYEMENRFNVKPNKNKLNLSEIICNKLKKCGINKIFDIKRCTFHEESSFFSYRRNQCLERMLSIIYA
ncbi:MAG: peptidoglycan editing factor PgeF [Endomicrobium sp.]|jgi:YfiH family protein|nr:peptidoglycan editing factor PgeF [Endomicrobium sp.]